MSGLGPYPGQQPKSYIHPLAPPLPQQQQLLYPDPQSQQQQPPYAASPAFHRPQQPQQPYIPQYAPVPLGPPPLPHAPYQHYAHPVQQQQQPLQQQHPQQPHPHHHHQHPSSSQTPYTRPPDAGNKQQPQPAEKGREGGKKVTVHPVKNACLNCRARKMKCTGEQPICLHCSKKGILCEYVKSKRGGARKRKDPASVGAQAEDPLALFLKRMTDLASFKASSDPALDLAALTLSGSGKGKGVAEGRDVVREYRTMRDVVDGYHAIIYPYLPILPPPAAVDPSTLVAYLTSPRASASANGSSTGGPSKDDLGALDPGPLALAFLAILVLHPHPSDPAPQSAQSKARRKLASEAFARRALEEVDEALECAGQNGNDVVELQIVQTLIIMVTWEFAEKGNMVKMRLRQGHALQLAMDLGLHLSDKGLAFAQGDEWQRDMRRRTWWIAFAQLCQASVLSGIPPSLPPFDPRITAEFPDCALDPDLWPNQMGAIRHISRVFQLIIQADFPDAAAPDAAPSSSLSIGRLADAQAEAERLKGVHREMIALDRKVLLSLKELEKKSVHEVRKGMGAEEHMAHNFQTSTLMSLSTCEIALHRRAAFPEVAFFSKKLCGLPSLNSHAGPSGSISGGRPPISPSQLVQSARINSIPPSSTASSSAPLPAMGDVGTPGSVDGGPSAGKGTTVTSGSSRGGGVYAPHVLTPSAVAESSAVENIWGSEDAAPVAYGWTPPAVEKEHFGTGIVGYATEAEAAAYVPVDTAHALQQPDNVGIPVPQGSGDFAIAPPTSQHQGQSPWFATDAGAASLVYNPEINPYATLLGNGPGSGSGFGFLPDTWAPPPAPSFDTVDRYALNTPDLQPYFGAFPEIVAGQQLPSQPRPQSFPYGLQQSVSPPSVVNSHPSTDPPTATLPQLSPPQSRSAGTSVHSASPSQSTSFGLATTTQPTPSVMRASRRPWGLDDALKPISRLVPSPANQVARLTPAERLNAHGEEVTELLKASDVPDGPFPPGLSLERCSAAAHSIVRLETLQRTAAFTLLDGPVRALPFCACGLMASAYCFLLLALAIQAGESFDPRALESKKTELDSLYTNVRIILAGLAKYAEVWDGLSNLAQEVKAALDAAISLSEDLQQQRLTALEHEDDMSDDSDIDGEGEYGGEGGLYQHLQQQGVEEYAPWQG